MSLPLFSVIMNVRNGREYLGEAIDSVRAQSCGDWEIVFWDDNSSDESVGVAEAYGDARIRILRSPTDVPLGRARDSAIREARGEWLAFLDQDDVWLPRKLEAQAALAAESPDAGLLYGRTVRFRASGAQREYDHRHEFCALPEGDIFDILLSRSCFISMSSAVLRRRAVEDVAPIPRRIHVTPDYWLFLATARRRPARAVQEPVCRYRLHGANMSQWADRRMHEEIIWLMKAFGTAMDPRELDRRIRVHQTLLALAEMRLGGHGWRGAKRLVTRGSVGYLLSRPFARAARQVRRWSRRPQWRLCPPACGWASSMPPARVGDD